MGTTETQRHNETQRNSVTLCVTLPPWFKKIFDNDTVTEKKTFANLGTLGSADPGWDHCCMDGCAEEGNTGVDTATIKDIKLADKNN